MTSTPQYEIHAIKYAEAERETRDCFLMPDPHDGPMPMDYFVWLIRGAGRTVLLDTGFGEARAKARKRMLDQYRSAQIHNILGAVISSYSFPTWAICPFGLQFLYLLFFVHDGLPCRGA